MWAAQYYKYKAPHQLPDFEGLGTMGYGLGAAIRIKIRAAREDRHQHRRGRLLPYGHERDHTAARYNIPVIEVVINNHVLGMVRQWQTLFYGKRFSNTILNDNVDFVKLTEAMGAVGIRVTKKEEFEPTLRKPWALCRPVVIGAIIDKDDKGIPDGFPQEQPSSLSIRMT